MTFDQFIPLGKILLAIILGSILGWQRERWGKSAGPRTYALVCGGATLFTILSITAFAGNMAHVAAAIVSGIGFLGAGTIIHKEGRVEGLTTAAGLWVVAAIGMAIGTNNYLIGIVTAALSLIVFMFDDRRWHKDKK